MAQFVQAKNFIFDLDNVAYIHLDMVHDDYDVKIVFKQSVGGEWIKFLQSDWDNRRLVDPLAKPLPPTTDESSLVAKKCDRCGLITSEGAPLIVDPGSYVCNDIEQCAIRRVHGLEGSDLFQKLGADYLEHS